MEGLLQQVCKPLFDKCRTGRLLCLLTWLLLAIPAAAQTTSVNVLLSSDKGYYQEVAKNLRHALASSDASVTTSALNKSNELPDTIAAHNGSSANRKDLLIAVGARACETLMGTPDKRNLLCTFLPRSAYLRLKERYREQLGKRALATIHLDQPLVRYFALIKLLMPKAEQLGTSVGPDSKALLPTIIELSKTYDLTLHHTELTEDTNPVAQLSPVVEQSDVFLANPDRASLNRVTAKWLLYLSIRQRIPVIAFSKAYVNAGALAAVYSSPADIGRDTGEMVAAWLRQGGQQPLTTERYPNYCKVRSNPNVARALGIQVPSNGELEKKLAETLSSSLTEPHHRD